MSGSPYGDMAAVRSSIPHLRKRMQAGETVYGASCTLGSPAIAEIIADAGLDFIYIDQQHGLTSFDTLVNMLRAIDRSMTTPIVRVRRNDAGLIGQALDAGADGVIVPMVNSRADAERAVAACRYAPLGSRSYGPFRAGLTRGVDIHAANERVICLVMIESASGLAQAEAITAVTGVDGFYIGQADLAVSLGLPAKVQIQPGQHQEAVDAILRACTKSGILTGLSGDGAAMRKAGFRFITLGSDRGFVDSGLRALVARRDAASGAA